jgi:uncharacterized phage-associated protein
MIEFAYDQERARHATLWLLKQHGALDHIKLLKLVLLADLEHLARYGRPIVGGEYFAMEHGPVASILYDELKLRSVLGTAAVNDFTLRGVEEPNEDYLAETDLEVLREINERFGAWDRYRLSDYTHTLEAWKKNYKGEAGGKKAYPIPYEDLLEERLDGEMLSLVRDAQRGERILG